MAGSFTKEEALALNRAKDLGQLLQHFQTIPKNRWLDICGAYSLIGMAVYENDIAAVTYLLENGFPVDHVGLHMPAVHIAACYGFDKLLQILLDAGGTHTCVGAQISALEMTKDRRIRHTFFSKPGETQHNHNRCIEILEDHDAKIRGEK